jgi:hypothetical protein
MCYALLRAFGFPQSEAIARIRSARPNVVFHLVQNYLDSVERDLAGLEEAKTSGTFTGRSELRLALTEIVVNGQTVPLVSGEYELSGKSRGASTAKRTVGGAAIGSIIGAIAGGGKGAAIGAGAGGALGAGSEIITKGDQVKVPSETLLDFTLQDSVSVPVQQN